MSEKGSDEGLEFVRDVFGSDMEDEGDAAQRSRPAPVLDDFSDEDDEEEAPRRRVKDKQRSHSKSKRSSDDRRRRDESDGDDADDLDLRRDSKRRRLHRATSDDDDNFIDDTGVEKQESDEDDNVRTEGGLRIGKDIEDNSDEEPKKPKNAFEDAVEKNRALRRPRRKELDPRKVEAECIAFLERMVRARDDDVRAYENGQPALEKLKMLREVEMMTTKVSHREVLLENMLLPVIKAWLDPMHDGALPNVQIRTTLLQILSDIKIDADWVDKLKRSQGLGRSINFLSRHDDHLPNRRMAEKLFQKWARPVFNSNANFHDILDEFDRPDEGRRGPKDGIVSTRRAAQQTVKHFKTAREKIESFKNTAKGDDQSDQVLAQVPRPTPFLFTALAEGGVNVDEKQMRERRTQQATTKKVNRTMANMRRLNKTRSARAAKPSVNGRF